jgi:hypothetical protein
LAAPATPAAPFALAPYTTSTHLAAGVRLLQVAVPGSAPGGPLIVTAVEVDRAAGGAAVRAALTVDVPSLGGKAPSRGRQTVSWLTAQRGALAGINAAFFPYTSVPIGLHVEDGEFVTPPGYNRCVFWIGQDGAMHFEVLTFQGLVRDATGASVSVSGMDRPSRKDALILYTPRFLRSTPIAPGRFEAVVHANVNDIAHAGAAGMACTIVSSGEGGGTSLAPGTIALSAAPGPAADLLRRDATAGPATNLTISLSAQDNAGHPFDLSQVAQAVTGGPRLLTAGAVTVDAAEEGFTTPFSRMAVPRSGIGMTTDGKILLVTVDGRQPGISSGISLTDFAALLRDLGCTDAMNLDGGGSSTLSVRGYHVNSPSEGAERPVASALLVIPALPASDDAGGSPRVQAADATAVALPTPAVPVTTMLVGRTLPLPDPPAGRVWGVQGGIGYVSQADRLFHALHPGPGRIGDGDPQDDIAVVVSGSASAPSAGFSVQFSVLPMPFGDTPGYASTVLIRVRNGDGDPLIGATVRIDVTGGTANGRAATTDAQGVARFGIFWDAAAPAAPRHIAVSSPTAEFPPTSWPTTPGAVAPTPTP